MGSGKNSGKAALALEIEDICATESLDKIVQAFVDCDEKALAAAWLAAGAADRERLFGSDRLRGMAGMAAAAAGDEASAREAARRGWDFGTRDRQGAGAGHYAAKADHPNVLMALLEMGWDPDEPDNSGGSAGHWAAMEGSLRSLRALLEAGWDPNASDSGGKTAGHWAALNGKPEPLREMAAFGWDLRAEDKSGFTAGHSAAMCGKSSALSALLELGMDPSEGGRQNMPLPQVARIAGNWECAALLGAAILAKEEKASLSEIPGGDPPKTDVGESGEGTPGAARDGVSRLRKRKIL